MRNKPTSFFREVGIGLLLSVLAAAVTTVALVFFPGGIVIRAVIAAVALAYLVVPLGRSAEKSGRIVMLAIWFAVIGTAWISGIGIAPYLARSSLNW